MTHDTSHEIEEYGDPRVTSADAKVPRWLLLSYILLPIWGFFCFYFFWNGSIPGFMENGHWHELQKAANTTFPIQNQNDPASFEKVTEQKKY
ncbi:MULTISPECIES: hypothetical protein [Parachlamydia]|jgi:hypothetical protein|uniref:Uncharacterized protein n=1 Tax=Parachlamydia acanthamoebae (strain UV7) TaxID=765952 RepID=F8KV91_PARAV|nr:hypothetical protein [Parachlamydia acanthamoebae]CCB87613.1 putative uncharacterized protein [Parachlamydia acanthamoebae UV-7]